MLWCSDLDFGSGMQELLRKLLQYCVSCFLWIIVVLKEPDNRSGRWSTGSDPCQMFPRAPHKQLQSHSYVVLDQTHPIWGQATWMRSFSAERWCHRPKPGNNNWVELRLVWIITATILSSQSNKHYCNNIQSYCCRESIRCGLHTTISWI